MEHFTPYPLLNALAELLLNEPVVTHEMIRQRFRVSEPKVFKHRLSRHMPEGITIKTRRGYNEYWLEPEDKKLIRKMVS